MLAEIYKEHGIVLPPSLVYLAVYKNKKFEPSVKLLTEIKKLVLSDKVAPYKFSSGMYDRIDDIVQRLVTYRFNKDSEPETVPWMTDNYEELSAQEKNELMKDYYNDLALRLYKEAGLNEIPGPHFKHTKKTFAIKKQVDEELAQQLKALLEIKEPLVSSIDKEDAEEEIRDSLKLIFELEIERSRKKMITVYHARSSAMFFFDMISRKLRNTRMNKGRYYHKSDSDNTIKRSALEMYQELFDTATTKYHIFGINLDKSIKNTHAYFDEVPEARTQLTAVNLSLFSNIDMAGESTAQLWVQDASVSAVNKLSEYILQNFHELTSDQSAALNEMFHEFYADVEESNSYGQLLSIGIPIEKAKDVIYTSLDGGILYKSGDVVKELLRLDTEDDEDMQARLVNVKFEDLNTEFIELLDSNITERYEKIISDILKS